MKTHRKYSNDIDSRIPFLTQHLGKFAPSGKQTIRNKIITLELFLQNEFNVSLLDAKYEHLEYFFMGDEGVEYEDDDFKPINRREIRKDSKRYWYFVINSYYETVVKRTKKTGKQFENPMPDIELLNFTENKSTLDEQIEKLMDDDAVFQLKDALRVIEFFYYNEESMMMFQMCLQLLSHGGRIEEIIKAETTRLDLEERFFLNLVKSRKHERLGIFFFPEWVAFHLKTWVEHLKEIYGVAEVKKKILPKTKYLFPSINRGPLHHVSKATVERKLKKVGQILNIKAKCNPHAWRNMLNEVRESAGITPARRALLLNQTPPGGVNTSSYLESMKHKKTLREIYDISTPIPEPDYLKRYRESVEKQI